MHVEPPALADIARALQWLAITPRQREGNLSYDAAVDDATAGRLLIAERWRDQAALTAHLHAADTLAFVDRWRDRITGDVMLYDVTRERQLMDEQSR